MLSSYDSPDVEDRSSAERLTSHRVPFGFSHALHRRDLFSSDSLRALADGAGARDHFVASGAPQPDTPFYAVEHGRYTPVEAFDDLATGRHRILIKRPEEFDVRFRRLLDGVFAELIERYGDLGGDRIVRLESSVLISSANAITPFHFDPETSFFFQIAGTKIYHLYDPRDVSETELERFYKMNVVNIGQLELAARNGAREHVFALAPGSGLHQPHGAPHWVETQGARCVSYVVAFETASMRALGLTRAFNHYQRKTGLSPAAPGRNRSADALKAASMSVALPLRRVVRGALRAATGR